MTHYMTFLYGIKIKLTKIKSHKIHTNFTRIKQSIECLNAKRWQFYENIKKLKWVQQKFIRQWSTFHHRNTHNILFYDQWSIGKVNDLSETRILMRFFRLFSILCQFQFNSCEFTSADLWVFFCPCYFCRKTFWAPFSSCWATKQRGFDDCAVNSPSSHHHLLRSFVPAVVPASRRKVFLPAAAQTLVCFCCSNRFFWTEVYWNAEQGQFPSIGTPFKMREKENNPCGTRKKLVTARRKK